MLNVYSFTRINNFFLKIFYVFLNYFVIEMAHTCIELYIIKSLSPSFPFTTTILSHSPDVDIFNGLGSNHFPDIFFLGAHTYIIKKTLIESYHTHYCEIGFLNLTVFSSQPSMSIYKGLSWSF